MPEPVDRALPHENHLRRRAHIGTDTADLDSPLFPDLGRNIDLQHLTATFDLPSLDGVEEVVINREVAESRANPLFLYGKERAETSA